MAASYANLFGTNGAGRRNRVGNMFGQQPAQQSQVQAVQPIGGTPVLKQAQPSSGVIDVTGGGMVNMRQAPQQAPQPTFAQMQQQGQARPAPPQPQAYAPYQGSQQAQAARAPMLQAVQQQLAQPTRFDTAAFQQIRSAQQANLQSEFEEQQRALNEDLARRGLSASSIAGSGLGRLAGAQSRALADIDAQLLQQAAQTQAQDRLAALQAGGQFAELAGAQDLAEFEARRVGQAQQFQEGLSSAQFGEGQRQFDIQQQLQRLLGLGGLGLEQQRLAQQGQQFGVTTAEQQRQFDIQQELQRQLGLGGLGLQERELAQRQVEFGAGQQLERERLAQQQQQFGAQLGLNRDELALRGDLGRAQQQLAEQRLAQEGRLEEARQGLQEKELGQRQEQFYASLGAEEQRFARTLDEQRAQRVQQLGVSNRELDLRAQQLQQEAQLQGRSLDLQGARDAAEVDFRARQLQQQESQFGRTLSLDKARQQAQEQQFAATQAQQADQFTRTLGADEQRFVRTLAEQQASRLQQLGISNRDLDLQAARLQQEGALQGRSLTLQEARDQAEISYRAAQLQQQAQLQGRALDIEQARNEATIGFQRDQLAVEQNLRQQGIDVDRDRLTQANRQFDEEMKFRGQQLAQQESQFGRQLTESKLDRELRQTLGQGQLTQQQQQFQLQLAAAMAGLPQNVVQQLLASPLFGGRGTQAPTQAPPSNVPPPPGTTYQPPPQPVPTGGLGPRPADQPFQPQGPVTPGTPRGGEATVFQPSTNPDDLFGALQQILALSGRG